MLQYSFSCLENRWRMSRTTDVPWSHLLCPLRNVVLFVCFVWFKEQYLDVLHFFSVIFITTDWGLSQKDFSKTFNRLGDCKFLTSHTCFVAPSLIREQTLIKWLFFFSTVDWILILYTALVKSFGWRDYWNKHHTLKMRPRVEHQRTCEEHHWWNSCLKISTAVSYLLC